MTTSTRIHLFCDKQTSLQFCTILLILVIAKFDHNLRSDTFKLRRKTETDCALDENEKDLLQHDVHVTCDPILIKCSRKTRRKNTIQCYAQLSKSRPGKKNSTVFVSKLGVDHGNILCTDPPPLKENPEGRGVCTQGIMGATKEKTTLIGKVCFSCFFDFSVKAKAIMREH